jgi:hypothetical protein
VSKLDELLKGGDPRKLKGVTYVADVVLHDPTQCAALVDAMSNDDPVVRMRAGDAAEKISRTNPEILEPYKARLLQAAAATEQPSLRWHLAQMIPRLALDAAELRGSAAIFKTYLSDPSAIVKTCAMQALADIARADPELRRSILPVIAKATETGTAAMRARGERLLDVLHHRKIRR